MYLTGQKSDRSIGKYEETGQYCTLEEATSTEIHSEANYNDCNWLSNGTFTNAYKRMLYSSISIQAVLARITEDSLIEFGSQLDDEKFHHCGLSNEEFYTFLFYWTNEMQLRGEQTWLRWQQLTAWKHDPSVELIAGRKVKNKIEQPEREGGIIKQLATFVRQSYTAVGERISTLLFGPRARDITIRHRPSSLGRSRPGRLTEAGGYPDLPMIYIIDEEMRNILWKLVMELDGLLDTARARRESMLEALRLPRDALKQTTESVLAGKKRKGLDMRSCDLSFGETPSSTDEDGVERKPKRLKYDQDVITVRELRKRHTQFKPL